jgi:hypothetical protein
MLMLTNKTPARIAGVLFIYWAGAVKAVCVWGIWQPETKKQLQMVSIQNRFSD